MSEIKTIQSHLLGCLSEIDRICRKNGIRYFLHGGTLLGAFRHEGFIPWDDDADVVFLREDYDRFLIAAKSELQEPYHLILPEEQTEFFDLIPKVSDFSVTYNTQQFCGEFCELYQHPNVDLFVFDYALTGLGRKLQLLGSKLIYALCMSRRPYTKDEKYRGVEKIGAKILPAVGKLCPLNFWIKQYRSFQQVVKKPTQLLYISNDQPGSLWHIYQTRWYANSSDHLFENHFFSVLQESAEMLSSIYGNYLELPPIEKQKPGHFDIQYP